VSLVWSTVSSKDAPEAGGAAGGGGDAFVGRGEFRCAGRGEFRSADKGDDKSAGKGDRVNGEGDGVPVKRCCVSAGGWVSEKGRGSAVGGDASASWGLGRLLLVR
jgi:hypothetical protein